jgi:hypothetical protein
MLLLLLLARGGFVIAATTITTRARLCSALVRELAGRTFPRQSYVGTEALASVWLDRCLRFTAKIFAPVCSEKQGYGGTKIEIPVRKRSSERKIQESGGFLQECAT